MARYSEIFRDTRTQAPIAGALVTVTDYADVLAVLTDDEGGPIDNPFKTGISGDVTFNVTKGVYNIIYSYGGRVISEQNGVVIGDLIIAVEPSPANAGKFVALDANGVPVYASGTGADAALRTDLAAGGANLVGLPGGGDVADLDFVTPSRYGAAGNGSTNDRVALLNALQSGKPVDGLGLNYAIDGTLAPTSLKSLKNATLTQIGDRSGSNAQTLSLIGLSNFTIENVVINMGSGVTTLFADDGNSGLYVGGVDAATYIENFTIRNVRVTGNGCGAGIQIRHGKRFTVSGCLIHDRLSGSSPDPTNDSQNGIQLVNCSNFAVTGCGVSNLLTRLSGTPTLKWTRGFTFVECRDGVVTGNYCNSTDQGYDFSGAYVSALGYIGNRRLSVTGNLSSGCGTYGFKFANVTRDIMVSGCVAANTGTIAFVFSSSAVALPVGLEKYNTQNIDVVGCKVINVLGNGWSNPGAAEGFRVMSNPTYPNWPQGVRLKDCHVSDTQDTPTTVTAYSSDVTPLESPAAYLPSYLVNCTADDNVANFTTSDIGTNATIVTGTTTQSVPNSVWTDIAFDSDIMDRMLNHSTSSNAQRIYVKTSGWFSITASVSFAGNATGQRLIRLKKNNTVIDRTTDALVGGTAANTMLKINVYEYADSGDYFSIEGFQNSGGSLNVLVNESRFSVIAQ